MHIPEILVDVAADQVLYHAGDSIAKMLDKMADKMEKKSRTKIEEFLNKHPNNLHLCILREKHTWKETYRVLDMQHRLRYMVKGKALSRKHHLRVYDATGKKKIGEVKEKLFAIRPLIFAEPDPKDFDIIVGDQKIGMIKTKRVSRMRKLVSTFNDWKIESCFRGGFRVMSGENPVLEVCNEWTSEGDLYVLDIAEPSNEFLCVLVALVYDADKKTKSKERKETARHKSPI